MSKLQRDWPVLIASFAMAYVCGCSGRSDQSTARPVSGTSTPGAAGGPVVASSTNAMPAAAEKPASDTQIVDWTNPAAVLLVSGEQNGYLEPCGCTAGQLGGLRRRYDLCEKLKAQGWPLVPVDLGSVIKDPAASLGGLEQTKVKFTVAMRALKLMNYQAISLAANDLKLGVLEVLGQYLNMTDGPKIVAANVKPAAGFEQTIVPSHIAAAGSKKIGITSVVDPKSLESINDPTIKDLLPASDPSTALKPVAEALAKGTDFQVLLVQGPPEMAKRLAAEFPVFDVVVASSVYEDPTNDADKVNDGKTLIVNVGKKGKYNGLVGFFADSAEPVKYKRITLGSKFDGEKAGEPIRKLIDEDFQAELKAAKVVEDFPRRSPINAVPGSTYVGAGTCKDCHPNTYTKWLTTKHAHAYEPLKNPKRNREFDAECISCHTTGFEYDSGWVSADKTPWLQGNQCENCHGPASFHVGDPDNAKFRAALALKAETADKNMLCIKCHDADNSPKFNFASFWPQVMHKGLDKYDNPKVHKGLNGEEIARLKKVVLADQQPKDNRVQKTNY